jgi:hypothetical protein
VLLLLYLLAKNPCIVESSREAHRHEKVDLLGPGGIIYGLIGDQTRERVVSTAQGLLRLLRLLR